MIATASSAAQRPVRVAQLLHTMAHGGVETAILNWNKAFDRRRLDAHLVCFRNPGGTEQPFVEAAQRHGFTVEFLPWSRVKPVLRAARLLAHYLRRNEIEVLHCHNTYANLVGLLAARMVPVRTVTTFYVWGNFGFKRNVLQWVDRLTMRFFDQVTAHCETCLADTVRRGMRPDEVELLICGYPPERFEISDAQRARLRTELGAAPNDHVLVYLARFWPEKAHDNLLDAFRLVLERHPPARLWLPGSGPELERVQAKAEMMGFGGRVQFLGFFPDFHRLLTAADMQVHPSDNEGVALAVLAGMAAGLPIVATRVGGLLEILRPDRSAVMVEPRRPEELARAIGDLIEDRVRAAALGAAARRFVETEYSLEAAANRVQSLYERLARL